MLLLRFLLPRGRRPRHYEIVDIVIVNLRAIVDGGVGDVAADVIDDVGHDLAVMLGHGGRGLLDHLIGGGPGLFGMGFGFGFRLIVLVCHWLRARAALICLLWFGLGGGRREDDLADILQIIVSFFMQGGSISVFVIIYSSGRGIGRGALLISVIEVQRRVLGAVRLSRLFRWLLGGRCVLSFRLLILALLLRMI